MNGSSKGLAVGAFLALAVVPARADPAGASEGFLSQASAAAAKHDHASARALATRAIELDPNNARAYVQRASSELSLKDYDQAEKDATLALTLKFERAAVYNVRSASYSRRGRFQEGFADADHAVRLSPQGPIGYLNRGAARWGLRQPKEDVLADFRRAAELDPRLQFRYDEILKQLAPGSSPAPAPVPKTGAKPTPKAVAGKASPAKPAPSAAKPQGLPFGVNLLTGVSAVLVVGGLLFLLLSGRQHECRQVRFGALMDLSIPPEQTAPGAVIGGRYIMGRLIRREGRAELYEARTLDDQPLLARRLHPADAEAKARLLARARPAAALRHAHIARLEGVFDQDGAIFLVYEPLPKESLRSMLDKSPERRLPAEFVLNAARGVCAALDYAHQAGVTHGGLTLDRLLVGNGEVKIADFGCPVGSDAEPPSIEGDIRALGACLGELLGGAQGPGAVFAPALARAAGGDPAARYRSAGQLFEALQGCAAVS